MPTPGRCSIVRPGSVSSTHCRALFCTSKLKSCRPRQSNGWQSIEWARPSSVKAGTPAMLFYGCWSRRNDSSTAKGLTRQRSREFDMTNDASMAGLAGAVRVRRYGEVTLHSYVAPEEGLLVNTQIVEGPTKLVIFDGQYFLRYAAE